MCTGQRRHPLPATWRSNSLGPGNNWNPLKSLKKKVLYNNLTARFQEECKYLSRRRNIKKAWFFCTGVLSCCESETACLGTERTIRTQDSAGGGGKAGTKQGTQCIPVIQKTKGQNVCRALGHIWRQTRARKPGSCWCCGGVVGWRCAFYWELACNYWTFSSVKTHSPN